MYLVQVFSSKKRRVILLLQMRRNRARLGRRLPDGATAVARDRVVDGAVIVHVVAGENGRTARTTQRTGDELGTRTHCDNNCWSVVEGVKNISPKPSVRGSSYGLICTI